jgi:hypothetical protein
MFNFTTAMNNALQMMRNIPEVFQTVFSNQVDNENSAINEIMASFADGFPEQMVLNELMNEVIKDEGTEAIFEYLDELEETQEMESVTASPIVVVDSPLRIDLTTNLMTEVIDLTLIETPTILDMEKDWTTVDHDEIENVIVNEEVRVVVDDMVTAIDFNEKKRRYNEIKANFTTEELAEVYDHQRGPFPNKRPRGAFSNVQCEFMDLDTQLRREALRRNPVKKAKGKSPPPNLLASRKKIPAVVPDGFKRARHNKTGDIKMTSDATILCINNNNEFFRLKYDGTMSAVKIHQKAKGSGCGIVHFDDKRISVGCIEGYVIKGRYTKRPKVPPARVPSLSLKPAQYQFKDGVGEVRDDKYGHVMMGSNMKFYTVIGDDVYRLNWMKHGKYNFSFGGERFPASKFVGWNEMDMSDDEATDIEEGEIA